MKLTDKEVLKKAIDIAIGNGFEAKFSVRNCLEEYMIFKKYYPIIFSHEFAKAFFIKKKCECSDMAIQMGDCRHKDWKQHLEKMVVTEKPIDYLRKFI